MSLAPRSSSWLAILAIPWLFAAALLARWSRLSQWGEGLWPEWLGVHVLGTAAYPAFAAAFRLWTFSVFVMAAAIAFAFWFVMLLQWPRRLREFQVAGVLSYRRLVAANLGWVVAISITLALVAAMRSPELQAMPVGGWIASLAAVGAFGALQFMMAVFAFETTHRLFTGR